MMLRVDTSDDNLGTSFWSPCLTPAAEVFRPQASRIHLHLVNGTPYRAGLKAAKGGPKRPPKTFLESALEGSSFRVPLGSTSSALGPAL